MAATLWKTCRLLCRDISHNSSCIFSDFKFSASSLVNVSKKHYANSSDSSDNNRLPRVSLTSDGSTFVCWHPEPTHPYEHTEPLPQRCQTELEFGDSALKVQHLKDEKFKYRETGPSDEELKKMFFTTKHRWFPRNTKRFRRAFRPKDRESL